MRFRTSYRLANCAYILMLFLDLLRRRPEVDLMRLGFAPPRGSVQRSFGVVRMSRTYFSKVFEPMEECSSWAVAYERRIRSTAHLLTRIAILAILVKERFDARPRS